MKKTYISPDLEAIKFTLRDVILSSPTEGVLPATEVRPELDDSDFYVTPGS